MENLNERYISLWSGPRNVSTALMYSFAQRQDAQVFDEPLYAYYLKRTKLQHPGYEDIIASMPTDSSEILDRVIFNQGVMPIRFYKNMAHHFIGLPWHVLDGLSNIFLMRHPALVINSYAKTIETFDLDDLGYELLLEMVNYVKKRFGKVFLIEGEQIQSKPEASLKHMCAFLDIPFDAKMLRWSSGPRKEDGVWAKYWYHQVHNSEGFNSPKTQNLNVDPKYVNLLEKCLPHYEKLKLEVISL